ncbi:MAG: universal stress protein [Gammaproteobacteria bacterium]
MSTYKHILVAIDGSEIADHALKEAILVGTDMQAQLRIVHVIDEVPMIVWATAYANLDAVRGSYRQAAEKMLDRALATVQNAGLEADIRLIENTTFGPRVGELVTHEAETWPADLIVIGTHGRRGVSHVLLGSVAEAVVRVAPIPVLLVRGT